jgi:hypothetical protein
VGYSYCSALSTSRREARRAGPMAASTPATAATIVKATSEPTGTAKRMKTHVARVLMQLGVRDRVQAVVLAYESGVVAPGATSSE